MARHERVRGRPSGTIVAPLASDHGSAADGGTGESMEFSVRPVQQRLRHAHIQHQRLSSARWGEAKSRLPSRPSTRRRADLW
jgi:hypothetical protein